MRKSPESIYSKNLKPRTREQALKRRGFAVALTAGLIAVGFAADNALDAAANDNEHKDVCEINMKAGDTVYEFQDELGQLNGFQILMPNGMVRTVENTPHLLVPGRYPHVGDLLRVADVEPDACQAIGGTALTTIVEEQKPGQ